MHSLLLSSFLLWVSLPSTLVSACLYKRDGGDAMPQYKYSGETGPLLWHNLTADGGKTFPYAKCATGREQSPINVDDRIPLAENATTMFPSSGEFTIENNGHSIEVTPEKPDDYRSVLGGEVYKLNQLHFHVTSEHLLRDEAFPMEVHFVHSKLDDPTKFAVIGIFLELTAGGGDTLMQSICPGLEGLKETDHASSAGEQAKRFKLQLSSVNVLVNNSQVRTYPGSLTTPPCSEGISWYVVEKRLTVSIGQFSRMKDIIKFNSRFIQNDSKLPAADNLLALVKRT